MSASSLLRSVAIQTLLLVTKFFFFFNDTATTEIYTLSLHDALPICIDLLQLRAKSFAEEKIQEIAERVVPITEARSEEHTSELQSRPHLVCRLLLEKKKKSEQRDKHM